MKQCNKCLGWYSEAFFRSNKVVGFSSITKRATCIGCQQTKSDTAKQLDRFVAKAHQTTHSHARGLGISVTELRSIYGWTLERVRHLLEHGYENTCTYCFKPYSSMGHGPRDITLDIIDPSKKPFIRTNVTTCCATCNSEKSDMNPEQWEERKLDWRRWNEQQSKLPVVKPNSQPDLFQPNHNCDWGLGEDLPSMKQENLFNL